MKHKSIIQNGSECYICRRPATEVHHCLFGTADRKKADEDGLFIPVCRSCHNAIHNPKNDFDKWLQKALKQIAQEKWMEYYHKKKRDFIIRYGKNYLG